MELVKDIKEIKENINTLDRYLREECSEKEFAINLIKRGTCFIAIKQDNGYLFYPSRFIGYKNNNQIKHKNNQFKDGRETNQKIIQILAQEPKASEEMENEYYKFCFKLGFTPNKKGTYGISRKYWILF